MRRALREPTETRTIRQSEIHTGSNAHLGQSRQEQ